MYLNYVCYIGWHIQCKFSKFSKLSLSICVCFMIVRVCRLDHSTTVNQPTIGWFNSNYSGEIRTEIRIFHLKFYLFPYGSQSNENIFRKFRSFYFETEGNKCAWKQAILCVMNHSLIRSLSLSFAVLCVRNPSWVLNTLNANYVVYRRQSNTHHCLCVVNGCCDWGDMCLKLRYKQSDKCT